MVYEILATTPFGKEKKGEVGIERMVEEGAYSAAFPLHDVSLFFLMHKNYKKNYKGLIHLPLNKNLMDYNSIR